MLYLPSSLHVTKIQSFSGIAGFFFLLLFSLSTLASPPPFPPQKITEMKDWTEKPKALKENASALSQKEKKIEAHLSRLKKDLSKKALDIQKAEQDLKDLQKGITGNQNSIEDQKKDLDQKKSKIASLIVSLVKMNSIPVDTLMLLPHEKSEDLMISYHMLRALHPEINKQINALETQITRLEEKKKALDSQKETKKKQTEALKEKRKDISGLIKKRQKDHIATAYAYKDAQTRALEASKASKNLEDLIRNVQKKNTNLLKVPDSPKKRTKKASKPVFKASKTKRLPVSGSILTRYGGIDRIGAKSQGLTIQAVSGALVVSPKAGIVKYSGEFKKYGRIILLEHGKNYHSFIAGLETVDTVVGQKVSEGEPIGSIQNRANVKHSVYYELRLNGKPVNPLTHLSRL